MCACPFVNQNANKRERVTRQTMALAIRSQPSSYRTRELCVLWMWMGIVMSQGALGVDDVRIGGVV